MFSLTAGGSCLFIGLCSSQRVTRRCIGLADALENYLSLAFATFAAERAFHFGPCQDDSSVCAQNDGYSVAGKTSAMLAPGTIVCQWPSIWRRAKRG
jgi:hypothetical protein